MIANPHIREWVALPLPMFPVAVNGSEVIVGNDETLGGVRYHNGAYAGLPRINNETTGGLYRAVDINAPGAILGTTDRIQYPGVIWSGLSTQPMGPASVGVFIPLAINDNQMVVGWSGDSGDAYRWTAQDGYTHLVRPTGRTFCKATDVNNSGIVVGTAERGGNVVVVMWDLSNKPTIIDPFIGPGGPWINNAGDVVWDTGSNIRRRSSTGVFSDVPPPVGFERLTAVSESGRLAGVVNVGGVRRGWTLFKGTHTFFDPPIVPLDYFFEPTGINPAGSIVGVVHSVSTNPDYGLYLSRSGITPWSDIPPVIHP